MRKKLSFTLCLVLFCGVTRAATVKVLFVDQKQKPLAKVQTKMINLKTNEEIQPKVVAEKKVTFTANELPGATDPSGLQGARSITSSGPTPLESVGPEDRKKGKDAAGVIFQEVPSGDYQIYAVASGYRHGKTGILPIAGKDMNVTIVLPDEKEFKKEEDLAASAFQNQKWADAQNQYTKLLNWSPYDAAIASNLARTYIRLGDPGKAREAAKTTSQYEAKEPEKIEQDILSGISFEEGRMALEKRDFVKAINLMKEALKVEPDNADAYNGLALAYGHLGNYPEAIKNIDEALKLRPNDAAFTQIKSLLEHNAKVASQTK
jgi:Flp pilus assembly protein TadD